MKNKIMNEYWDLMRTFANLNEGDMPDEIDKWKKAQLAAEYKKKSVFSPEYLGGLPEKYGFHPQTFEGGDLEGMKDDLKNVVMSHGFRNEKHRQKIGRAHV